MYTVHDLTVLNYLHVILEHTEEAQCEGRHSIVSHQARSKNHQVPAVAQGPAQVSTEGGARLQAAGGGGAADAGRAKAGQRHHGPQHDSGLRRKHPRQWTDHTTGQSHLLLHSEPSHETDSRLG